MRFCENPKETDNMSLSDNRHRRKGPSQRALDIYRRHAVLGQPQADIARALGCSRRRIAKICRGVDRWINEPGRAVDPAAVKMAHHVLLTGLVRETLVEWERSKEPSRVTKARLVQGRTDKNGEPQSVVTSEQIDRDQCGNPRFLQVGNDLLKSIRAIWGAEASRSGRGVAGESCSLPMTLEALADYLASPAAARDRASSNVFDAEAVAEEMLAWSPEGDPSPNKRPAERRRRKAP